MPTDDRQNTDRQLTVPLDVRAACRSGAVETGEVPLAALPRCRDMAPDGGQLAYRVGFFESQGVQPLAAEVHIEAALALECARCRQTVVTPVTSTSQIRFVFSEDQAEHVEAEAEPVILGREGRVRLLDLLEDEVLMSVPLMPVHDQPCAEIAAGQAYESGELPEPSGEERENPFAALAALKKDPGGDQ
ncbi:YceD family protein [Guyparkeria hydrothermalis]|uniref:YceD family protein n=1 Tax=Guyparkeria hydrothermalis TaxID=923 RepID=UPI002021824B|nr:YceD family protein [Guyparkeria hydrothermalis]MCL7744547.1 YceD family protein [Guyparkeria hydrothermalis]